MYSSRRLSDPRPSPIAKRTEIIHYTEFQKSVRPTTITFNKKYGDYTLYRVSDHLKECSIKEFLKLAIIGCGPIDVVFHLVSQQSLLYTLTWDARSDWTYWIQR